MTPDNDSRREWIRVSSVFPFMDVPMMDRRTFRKNVFWGWVAAGASLVPASTPVDASQPVTTMLAMISCAPAAADPSPNNSDTQPASTPPVRTAGHLFAPPPIPKRLTDIDALIAEPGQTPAPSPRVRLAPSLRIPARQTPPSSDILRRLPKTDPLSDEPLVEPFAPEISEPEPGILPPAADNALQLDDNESIMMVPAEAGDGPVSPRDTSTSGFAARYRRTVARRPGTHTGRTHSRRVYSQDELVPQESVPEDVRVATEPGPAVELSPPMDIPQSSPGPDVSALRRSPPPHVCSTGQRCGHRRVALVRGRIADASAASGAGCATGRSSRGNGPRRALRSPRAETIQNAIATIHNVTARIHNAENLMARGACFAARAEMLQALKAIAQSLDEHDGTRRHGDALAFALRAFQEAGDLTPRGAGLASPVNLELTIRGHRTPVLWNENVNRLTPVAAQQRYMAYAQEQLAEACRGDMSAAETLYVLARINTVLESEKPESSLLFLPQAMVMYRVALEIDPRHGRAANELGVLLAGCGRYAEAR